MNNYLIIIQLKTPIELISHFRETTTGRFFNPMFMALLCCRRCLPLGCNLEVAPFTSQQSKRVITSSSFNSNQMNQLSTNFDKIINFRYKQNVSFVTRLPTIRRPKATLHPGGGGGGMANYSSRAVASSTMMIASIPTSGHQQQQHQQPVNSSSEGNFNLGAMMANGAGTVLRHTRRIHDQAKRDSRNSSGNFTIRRYRQLAINLPVICFLNEKTKKKNTFITSI